MVVDYLGVVGMTLLPEKADTSLIVDADTMVAFAVACEGFQMVAGWDGEVFRVV
ncbi:MAG: hypothetical protein ACSHYA_13200 [Opitutaceae bacterium]